MRAGQKWGAGQKKEDNGAILFVFTEDRKVRIEVGLRTRGGDPGRHREADHRRARSFRASAAGDYPGGIDAGAEAMMAAAKGEYKGTGRTVDEGKRPTPGDQLSGCADDGDLLRHLLRAPDPHPAPARFPHARRPGLVDGRRRLGWRAAGRAEASAAWRLGRRRGRRLLGRRRLVRRRRRLGELVGRWRAIFRSSTRTASSPAIAAAEKPDLRRDPRPRHPARARRTSRSARCGASTLLGMTKTAERNGVLHLHRPARAEVPDPRRRRDPREVRPGLLDRTSPRRMEERLSQRRVHRRRRRRASGAWARSSRGTFPGRTDDRDELPNTIDED